MIEITQDEYYQYIDQRSRPEDILPDHSYIAQERLRDCTPESYALQYCLTVRTKSQLHYRPFQTFLSVYIDTEEGQQEDELLLDQEGYMLDHENYEQIGYLTLLHFNDQDMLPFISKELELQ